MATRMTINGVSTCTDAGTEKYERFQSGIGRRKRTLVSTTTAIRTENCSLVSNPHWTSAEPQGTSG